MTIEPATFTLEQFARNSFHYYASLIDQDGLPYFNVFRTRPAEAVHDWPDFGDVMSRQLQAAIMGRVMTGERSPVEEVWLHKILNYIDPSSGLLSRPATSFSSPGPDPGDAALTLYTLATAYLESGDPELGQVVRKMVDGILSTWPVGGGWMNGFIIKSLMVAGRSLGGYEPAFERARNLVQLIFAGDDPFTRDNHFARNAHMHGSLRTLVGAADWALHAGDEAIYSRVAALYEFVRSITTRFGFTCEVYQRQDDIIACETCTLMDLVGLAVTLADHGHPEYWGDVERFVRNHLAESQVKDASWLEVDNTRPDTDQFSWHDLNRRILGAYAGWSSPNHILACHESLLWGGAELRDKPRLLQNCCGGSGTHAFFIAWKNAARVEDGVLSVNLHIDKKLPEAEIRGYQPYQGKLVIRLEEPLSVRVRIPEFTLPSQMQALIDQEELAYAVRGNYLDLGACSPGKRIEVTYPLPVSSEDISVGNPGFRQYPYRVTWKGDTVLAVEPPGEPPDHVYSSFNKIQVPVFYGVEGPGPLYQRSHWREDTEPDLGPIQKDSGALDLWKIT